MCSSDLTVGMERNRLRDPLTGRLREISGEQDRWVEASFRHDIPHSNIAWGASASHGHVTTTYFLTEIGRSWEGPVWLNAFVEHKDIAGLKVKAIVGNLLNARHRFDRAVYDGRRDSGDPIAYYQSQKQLIGPIFELSVRGNF